MKTSIFDMTFVLPPVVEVTEVEKDNPKLTGRHSNCKGDGCQENAMKTSIFDMRQMLSTVTRQPTTVGYFYG